MSKTIFFTSKKEDAPEDAIRLSRTQVVNFFTRLVNGWKPSSDVKWLNHGSGLLALGSGFTGLYLNRYYRQKLKLGTYGQLSTYLPIIVIPSFMSILFHKTSIHREIFAFQEQNCASCVQVRSAGVQLAVGVLQPAFLAPLSSFMFATRHFTFRIPLPLSEPRAFAKFYMKLSQPILFSMAILCGIQILLAFFVTHMEMTEFRELQLKMLDGVPEDALPPKRKPAKLY